MTEDPDPSVEDQVEWKEKRAVVKKSHQSIKTRTTKSYYLILLSRLITAKKLLIRVIFP